MARPRSVLEKALAWCCESDPFCRSIGVSILAQLGEDGKSYPDEAIAMIRSMIRTEQDHEVITSLISAVHFREVAEGAGRRSRPPGPSHRGVLVGPTRRPLPPILDLSMIFLHPIPNPQRIG
jgi:hypothetical protein